jgi:hypothetical protein
MGQTQDGSNEEKAPAVRYSETPATDDAVKKNGVEVWGVITNYQEKPDPRDDEHSIIHLDYEYEVDGQQFTKEIEFSINIVHIDYGYAGGLTHTPKFKYSLVDFRNSMKAGQKLKVMTLAKPPYSYFVEFNEIMSDVMGHEAVWR